MEKQRFQFRVTNAGGDRFFMSSAGDTTDEAVRNLVSEPGWLGWHVFEWQGYEWFARDRDVRELVKGGA